MSEKIEYSMVPIKMADLASFIAAKKGMAVSDAICYLYNSEFVAKLYDEKSKWWYLDNETLYELMEQERRNNSVDFSAQKVQFVITVLHRPRLLIFDEPFSGFDPVNAELLKREILKLKDEGHTIIFSTHNMASVEEICDHIALINHSKVVLQGAVTDIRSRYKSNQYELTMQSSMPLQNSDAFEIVSSEVQDEQTVNYKLRKLTSISNSELLSLVGAQGEICKFTECIPSMNDIFIRTVEGKI